MAIFGVYASEGNVPISVVSLTIPVRVQLPVAGNNTTTGPSEKLAKEVSVCTVGGGLLID